MATSIETPILNGPYDPPTHHFRFAEEGITSEVIKSRRRSAYFMPITRPKKKGA
jgi:type III restriction enzyme